MPIKELNTFQVSLLSAFDQGDSTQFNVTWNAHCNTDVLENGNARPLEFYLQLYFIAANWDADSGVGMSHIA